MLVLSSLRRQFNMTVPRTCKLSFPTRHPWRMSAHNSLQLGDVGQASSGNMSNVKKKGAPGDQTENAVRGPMAYIVFLVIIFLK